MGQTKLIDLKDSDMDGPFDVIKLPEEWRVVGRGFSIPCRDEQSARKTLAKVQSVWEA